MKVPGPSRAPALPPPPAAPGPPHPRSSAPSPFCRLPVDLAVVAWDFLPYADLASVVVTSKAFSRAVAEYLKAAGRFEWWDAENITRLLVRLMAPWPPKEVGGFVRTLFQRWDAAFEARRGGPFPALLAGLKLGFAAPWWFAIDLRLPQARPPGPGEEAPDPDVLAPGELGKLWRRVVLSIATLQFAQMQMDTETAEIHLYCLPPDVPLVCQDPKALLGLADWILRMEGWWQRPPPGIPIDAADHQCLFSVCHEVLQRLPTGTPALDAAAHEFRARLTHYVPCPRPANPSDISGA